MTTDCITVVIREAFFRDFHKNSEAFASEFYENHEEMIIVCDIVVVYVTAWSKQENNMCLRKN